MEVAMSPLVIASRFLLWSFFHSIGLLVVLVQLSICLAIWMASGALGVYIAKAKNRPTNEGWLFGLLLGPLGWLILCLLPTLDHDRSVESDSR
jgi:hypothetical protein